MSEIFSFSISAHFHNQIFGGVTGVCNWFGVYFYKLTLKFSQSRGLVLRYLSTLSQFSSLHVTTFFSTPYMQARSLAEDSSYFCNPHTAHTAHTCPRGSHDTLTVWSKKVVAVRWERWQNLIFLRLNTFFFQKSPLRISSPNACTKVVHRSQSPLHYDIRNI